MHHPFVSTEFGLNHLFNKTWLENYLPESDLELEQVIAGEEGRRRW
jgi:hypothetical protein